MEMILRLPANPPSPLSPGRPVLLQSVQTFSYKRSHADQAALEQQIDSPTVAFLRKPYELEALLETLQKVVEEQDN